MARPPVLWSVALGAALLISAPAAAQETGIPGRALLDGLVGRWDLEGTMGSVPLRHCVEARWALDGRFLEILTWDRDRSTAGRRPYDSRALIGWNRERRAWVNILLDSFGVPGSGNFLGYGAAEADSIAFRFDYPDGPFFTTYHRQPGAAWRIQLDAGRAGGGRLPFATKLLTRASACAGATTVP